MAISWIQIVNIVLSAAVLYLLILSVVVIRKFFGKDKADLSLVQPTGAAGATLRQADTGGNEVIAVISAAVAAYMAEEAPGASYTVTSVTPRIGRRQKELRPAWGFAGMRQNTEPF